MDTPHILRPVRAGGTSTTDSTPAAYFKCRGTACRAPTGGVWLREYWCAAADKNHPALRAPLLKKEGSLGRSVPAVCIRARAAGCPYNWGWFLLTTKAVYHRR